MFEMGKNWFDMFQQKYLMKGLVSWWIWWEKWKSYVFCVFKLLLNVLRVNLVESGYFFWKNSGFIYFDFLDVVRQDVVENLQLCVNLCGYE